MADWILALDLPFLLLPFRPHTDQSGAKAFIRTYFGPDSTRGIQLHGEDLLQELRLTEPMVGVDLAVCLRL
jgi:hypothetical protein